MTKDEALKKLRGLADILHDQRQNPSTLVLNSMLSELIEIYIADLQADNETTDLSANKAHDN